MTRAGTVVCPAVRGTDRAAMPALPSRADALREQPSADPASPPGSEGNRADRLDALIHARSHDEHTVHSLVTAAGRGVRSLFIPNDVEHTMTPDYPATRFWWLGREFANNLSYGFAGGQATSMALEMVVKAQTGGAVAIIGLGLGMYWFPKVVDQIRNASSVAASACSSAADRRPKAWFLAADAIDNLGNAAMSCAALVPSAYAPLSIATGIAFTVAGVFKRRAQANMFYRQAVNPTQTLPEVSTKESNQSILLNLVSVAAGAGLQSLVRSTALAYALPVIGCATAALGVAATVKFLSHLDMENINETVVRDAVEALDSDRELPVPDRRTISLVRQLAERDRIVLGRPLDRLKQAGAERYQQLLKAYASEKYLLESFKGQPYVVLKREAKPVDALSAMVQAIHVERLAASPAYAEIAQRDGSDAADFWVVEQSLAATRKHAPALLERLGAKGWATDLVDFRDSEERVTEEELARPLSPDQIALP